MKQVVGRVQAVLPRALYRVLIEGTHQVTAHPVGTPNRNFVRLVVGDRVMVELASSDRRRGRIVSKLGS